ncbi:MAG: helix-turn-helix domain-containing protein [Spirochaetaceae bacterium]|jgi:DNA-binding XRE family transcriptional regulator|nr:helix-turn-helix domain-containing protein [Spirochaetaceae bacterium]
MQVVERNHHIDITVTSGAEVLLPYLRKQWPDLKVVDDDELIDATESEVYRQIKAEMTNTPDEKLHLNRLRTGMTQAQLAQKCGIRRENISLMERGKRPIGLAVAKKLASALEMDYKELV